jgi:copper(I)-binding protein
MLNTRQKEKHYVRVQTLAGIVIAFAMSANALAMDYKAGSIEIMNPWSRATPKGAQTAVGYMTIKNNGTMPDRLIGGSTDVAYRDRLLPRCRRKPTQYQSCSPTS